MSISDNSCLLLGGASSAKIEKTFNSVTQVTTDGFAVAKQSMLKPRVHFGCCLSKHDRRVVVVGGQISAETTTGACEIFDIALNKWTQLPSIEKPLISCSIIVIDNKYKYRIGEKEFKASRSILYAFGGVIKENGAMNLSFDIQ